MVKLIKNYRSHQAILKYPNDRFYKGELEQCGESKSINSYMNSPILVSKRFPIVFHAMSGMDTREAASPSFFNIEEALQVKQYVEQLRSDRRYRISTYPPLPNHSWCSCHMTFAADEEIGIIAPYHAQCLKIRNALRLVAEGIKVGSTEEFQGQVRPTCRPLVFKHAKITPRSAAL